MSNDSIVSSFMSCVVSSFLFDKAFVKDGEGISVVIGDSVVIKGDCCCGGRGLDGFWVWCCEGFIMISLSMDDKRLGSSSL